MVQRADDRIVGFMDNSSSGRRSRRRDVDSNGDSNAALAGVPIVFRELLSKLPTHTGPLPDIKAFVDHLRKTVLPPRPVTEDEIPSLSAAQTQISVEPDVVLAGSKRHLGDEADLVDNEDNGDDDIQKDDIFKQRCRMRMSL